MDTVVRRNAYGRQLGSFEITIAIDAIGKAVPLLFIIAPLGSKVGTQVKRSEERRVGKDCDRQCRSWSGSL